MADWIELKRLAEAELPACCGEKVPTGVEYGGQREMMCCEAWQEAEVTVNAFDLLQLIAENEQLQAELDLGQAHGRALQRIGSALGLAAGSDLHTDCVTKIYSLFTSIGRTTAEAAQAHVRFSAERDQLIAEIESLRKELGRD